MKKLVAAVAYHCGLWRLLFFMSDLIGRKKMLVVLAFHRITDPRRTTDLYLSYDAGLDRDIFELHIRILAKYLDIIDQDTFLDAIEGRRELPHHSALLTFDDADSEIPNNVLPVLEKYNCPAVVFAPTDHIDTDKRFWHLRISNLFQQLNDTLLEKIRKDTVGLPVEVSDVFEALPSLEAEPVKDACRSLVGLLNKLDPQAVEHITDRLETAAGVEYRLEIGCMRWEELRQISERGVKVASHSASHGKVGQLPPDLMEKELVGSKAVIEQRLDRPAETICYPAGSFNDDVMEIAQAAGYRAGFTTQPGLCRWPRPYRERYRVPRLVTYGEDQYAVASSIGKMALRLLLGSIR